MWAELAGWQGPESGCSGSDACDVAWMEVTDKGMIGQGWRLRREACANGGGNGGKGGGAVGVDGCERWGGRIGGRK